MCKRFRLVRDHHDGVNSPGIVAEGVVFSSGKVALGWDGKPHSIQTFDSMADLLTVQNKNGITHVTWIDNMDPAESRSYTPGAANLRKSQQALRSMLGDSKVEEEGPGSLVVVLGSVKA